MLFRTIFRLAIPAFFRFTDVTEFMIGITIQYIQYIDHVAIIIVEKAEVEMKYNIERKEKLIRIWITMIRHGGLGH